MAKKKHFQGKIKTQRTNINKYVYTKYMCNEKVYRKVVKNHVDGNKTFKEKILITNKCKKYI